MIGNFKPILGQSMFLSKENRWRTFDEVPFFPVLASPKFDGIRVFTTDLVGPPGTNCVPVCRSMKQVPNRHVRALLSALPPGLDGELMSYDHLGKMRAFNDIQSDIMSEHGFPLIKFHVFDYIHDVNDSDAYEEPYRMRLARMDETRFITPTPDWLVAVEQHLCKNSHDLEEYEKMCLDDGFEGICYRDQFSPYKFGRSTWREQCLIKVKRFLDAEGVIVGFEELYSNQNAPEKNELGYQERSSHGAGMVPMNTLGAFIVKSPLFTETFKVGQGPGLTQEMRSKYWNERDQLLGRNVTFKYQSHGTKDRPRIPGFVGLRDGRDMSQVQQQLI